MLGSTAAALACEYLFTLMKAEDGQENNIFQPPFFVIIYSNYHGTAWQDLFLTFIKVTFMVNLKSSFMD